MRRPTIAELTRDPIVELATRLYVDERRHAGVADWESSKIVAGRCMWEAEALFAAAAEHMEHRKSAAMCGRELVPNECMDCGDPVEP